MYFISEILKDSHIAVCTVFLDDYYETVMQCCFAITGMNVLFFVQWIEINENVSWHNRWRTNEYTNS